MFLVICASKFFFVRARLMNLRIASGVRDVCSSPYHALINKAVEMRFPKKYWSGVAVAPLSPSVSLLPYKNEFLTVWAGKNRDMAVAEASWLQNNHHNLVKCLKVAIFPFS